MHRDAHCEPNHLSELFLNVWGVSFLFAFFIRLVIICIYFAHAKIASFCENI